MEVLRRSLSYLSVCCSVSCSTSFLRSQKKCINDLRGAADEDQCNENKKTLIYLFLAVFTFIQIFLFTGWLHFLQK